VPYYLEDADKLSTVKKSNQAVPTDITPPMPSTVVAVLVAGLLLYDYSLRRGRDPSEVTADQALKASLKANPGDESLTRAR